MGPKPETKGRSRCKSGLLCEQASDFQCTLYRNYKKGKSSIPSVSPTAAITCPHGDLLPDSQKSRRVAVSSNDWKFLHTDWTEKQMAALKEQIREVGSLDVNL